jgi:hypothetical protein
VGRSIPAVSLSRIMARGSRGRPKKFSSRRRPQAWLAPPLPRRRPLLLRRLSGKAARPAVGAQLRDRLAEPFQLPRQDGEEGHIRLAAGHLAAADVAVLVIHDLRDHTAKLTADDRRAAAVARAGVVVLLGRRIEAVARVERAELVEHLVVGRVHRRLDGCSMATDRVASVPRSRKRQQPDIAAA